MTSAMMTIADHMATDFREAVAEAEAADVKAIEKILHDMNGAYLDYSNKENLLNTKQEQAIRTLTEIGDLRDVNETTYKRRIEELREQLATLKASKTPALDPLAQAAMQYNPNVTPLYGRDPQAQASQIDAAKLMSKP